MSKTSFENNAFPLREDGMMLISGVYTDGRLWNVGEVVGTLTVIEREGTTPVTGVLVPIGGAVDLDDVFSAEITAGTYHKA